MADDKAGTTKLGAAVVGGYLLGRFKKGKLAMRLASQLSGQTPAQMLVEGGRQGAGKVMANDQVAEIVDQVKGPLMEALQSMMLAQVSSRVGRLSSGLENKTNELNAAAGSITTTATDAGDKGKEGAEKAKEGGKGLLGRLKGRGQNEGQGQGADKSGEDDNDKDQAEGEEPDTGGEPDEGTGGEEAPDTETDEPDEPTDSGDETDESGETADDEPHAEQRTEGRSRG